MNTSGPDERAVDGRVAADVASSATKPETRFPASTQDDLQRLRQLLLEPEFAELDTARRRLGVLERRQASLAARLPDALDAVAAGDAAPRVARALARPVAQALGAAVRENRQTLVDALFPVIGPLIRKAIAEALRNLVADLNGAVESSFSVRGLRWRLQAWRAGVPYAQVVLQHRLVYSIDHVFLIERGSGLVLEHASAAGLPPLDADAIAGMLTAIGDFVGDSVGGDAGTTLESAQVGDHRVWVVQGPRANLACFIRGVPPAALRSLLEHRLETFHDGTAGLPMHGALADGGARDAWRQSVQPMALVREASLDERARPASVSSRWPLLLIVLLALAALAWSVMRRERWDAGVDALRSRLSAQPGFVLTDIDAQPWRSISVHGLLDPDAAGLREALAAGVVGEVTPTLVATGYLSSDDAVVAHRAQRLLAAPDSVRLGVRDGVLEVGGRAPAAWIDVNRDRAAWVAGVTRVAWSVVVDVDPVASARSELGALATALESLQLPFSVDAELTDSGTPALDELVDSARRATTLAATARVVVRFVCVGANDEVGTDEANRKVRIARAEWLAQTLAARGVAGAPFATAEDAGLNRRVAYLRLLVEPAP